MPNGKGGLECCCCEYFRSDAGYRGYDAAYEAGVCTFHLRRLPTSIDHWEHRICIFFRAAPEYYQHNPGYELDGKFHQASPQIRFQWFEQALAEDTLYQFHYNNPPQSIAPLAKIADLPEVNDGATPPTTP